MSGGYFSGGNCPGGNCPGGNCPDTLLLHFLLNCLMQIKLKAVDPLVIEDYSIELQFQGKHVILSPVLEEDNMHFVFKWFLYCMCD